MSKNADNPNPDLPFPDSTVREKTGRGWDEWFASLDEAGADKLSHGEIVRTLGGAVPDLSGWWQQSIVVAYERSRGLREKHQTATGFAASVSRTLRVPVADLFQAWNDSTSRSRWLEGEPLTITTSTPPRTIRGRWKDGSRVAVYFNEKDEGKSQLSIQHTHLAERDDVPEVKAFWRERLGGLAKMLEEEIG